MLIEEVKRINTKLKTNFLYHEPLNFLITLLQNLTKKPFSFDSKELDEAIRIIATYSPDKAMSSENKLIFEKSFGLTLLLQLSQGITPTYQPYNKVPLNSKLLGFNNTFKFCCHINKKDFFKLMENLAVETAGSDNTLFFTSDKIVHDGLHVVALIKQGNKYYFYDPNDVMGWYELSDIKNLNKLSCWIFWSDDPKEYTNINLNIVLPGKSNNLKLDTLFQGLSDPIDEIDKKEEKVEQEKIAGKKFTLQSLITMTSDKNTVNYKRNKMKKNKSLLKRNKKLLWLGIGLFMLASGLVYSKKSPKIRKLFGKL